MPLFSKYIQAPWKATPDDAYGAPTDVLIERLREALPAIGVKLGAQDDPSDKGFFPAASDVDSGSPNLLDWGDHGLWLVSDIPSTSVTHRDYTGSFVYQEGHERNWKPAKFWAGYLAVRNIGQTADLPSDVNPPGWYRGGSIDLTGTRSNNDSWYAIVFRLKPNATYTFSFYVKKLTSGSVRFRVGTGAGFGVPSEPRGSNLVNVALDDTVLPVGTWTRLAYAFTTDANGYIVIHWGGWYAWANGCTLRLAYPQLEEGSTASPWAPPRYWRYYPLPTPQQVDHTLDFSQDDQGLLAITYPGSAVALRVDVCPDWTLTGGDAPRGRWLEGVSPSTAETTSKRNAGSYNWYRTSPAFDWTHIRAAPPLGVSHYGVLRYGTSGSYRIACEIRGVWIRHKMVGGMMWSDSSALTGPGHEKFFAFRITDLGNNWIRIKTATVMPAPGFQPTQAVEARYVPLRSTLFPRDGNPTYDTITAYAPHIMGVHSVDLDKASDLFIDLAGDARGWAINYFQGSSYKTALVVADFVDSPHPSDDGSVYPRWGMIIPNGNVGLVIASFGPGFADYWAAHGPGFTTASGWGTWNRWGRGPVGYNELVLGTRGFTRDYPVPLWVARADSVAVSNRGRAANCYVGLRAVTGGEVGDTLLAEDNTRYYYALRSPNPSGPAYDCLLLIRI